MNQDKDAFPNESFTETGLTKREYAAIHIMAGFAADPKTAETSLRELSDCAVTWAEALFMELDK